VVVKAARKRKGDGTVIGPGAQADGVFDIDHPVRVDGKLSGR
jgi:cytoskeletal protein CcmA (bactofilin family)